MKEVENKNQNPSPIKEKKMMKKTIKKIEIFTANCPMCDPVVKMVQDLACSNCEVIVYDMVNQCEDKTCLNKAKQYGVNRVPALAVNGKLLDCCQNNAISKESLIAAGIGQIE